MYYIVGNDHAVRYLSPALRSVLPKRELEGMQRTHQNEIQTLVSSVLGLKQLIFLVRSGFEEDCSTN